MNGTGRGQQLTTSQSGASLHFQRASVQRNIRAGTQIDNGLTPGSNAGTQGFQCGSDGKYFAVSLSTNAFFKRYVEVALERPDLYADPRDSSNVFSQSKIYQ